MGTSAENAVPVDLHCLRWGGDGGPTALLVHGVMSAAATWWRVAAALAEAGWRVVAPDLRGHGGSPPAVRHRVADHLADLGRLPDGRDGWDLVVGHSFGGALAAHALAADPGFARRAVLLDPVLRLPSEGFDDLVRGQLDQLALTDPAELQRMFPRWDPTDCWHVARADAACSPHAAEAVLRDNHPWTHTAVLDEVTTPVTILAGDPEAGAILDPADGRRWAGINPAVTYQLLSGVGHIPHRDDPDRAIELILAAAGDR
jgi:pimeloyl-ACP methyl ester carboxylesterase